GSSSGGVIGGGGAPSSSPTGAGAPLSPGGGSGVREEQEEEEEEEEGLEMHSKAFFTIGQLKAIVEKAAVDRQRGGYRQLKAIVFSQFLPVLNIVGDKFLREFGGHPERGWQERGEKNVAEFWGKNRAKELERFRTDPACFVLLLGKKGAHGLDLSFVTHMFLMDQIWDRSLETQVVARANRMGATGSVTVVQLIMKDTMEQELRSYVNNVDKARPRGAARSSPYLTKGEGLNNSAFGAHSTSRRYYESPASVAAATVTNGTPSPSPRKTPHEKGPWEKGGRKRPRPRGGGRRGSGGGGRSSASSSSSHQEHAKVHFLLTSLRSSKGVIVGGSGGGTDNGKKGGEEDGEEEEEQEEEEEEGGGRGDREGGGGDRAGWKGKGNKKAVAKRGVTFSGGDAIESDSSSSRRPAFAALVQPSAPPTVGTNAVSEMDTNAMAAIYSEIGANGSKISAKASEVSANGGKISAKASEASANASEIDANAKAAINSEIGANGSTISAKAREVAGIASREVFGVASNGSVNGRQLSHVLQPGDHFSGGGMSTSSRDGNGHSGVGGGAQ
ncbi:unnamed protein product, partial [Laminaria digitata]